jgi:hypothetical protein
LEVKELQAEARNEAINGQLALKQWFDNLDDKKKNIATRFQTSFKRELTKYAKDVDLDSSNNCQY